MSAPKRNSKPIARKTADESAGKPVSNEIPVIGTKNAARPPTPRDRPNADDLAAIPVCVEEIARKEPVNPEKRRNEVDLMIESHLALNKEAVTESSLSSATGGLSARDEKQSPVISDSTPAASCQWHHHALKAE